MSSNAAKSATDGEYQHSFSDLSEVTLLREEDGQELSQTESDTSTEVECSPQTDDSTEMSREDRQETSVEVQQQSDIIEIVVDDDDDALELEIAPDIYQSFEVDLPVVRSSLDVEIVKVITMEDKRALIPIVDLFDGDDGQESGDISADQLRENHGDISADQLRENHGDISADQLRENHGDISEVTHVTVAAVKQDESASSEHERATCPATGELLQSSKEQRNEVRDVVCSLLGCRDIMGVIRT